jgi:hypothetical protein
MGEEIDRAHFRQQDFEIFEQRLREETVLLERLFEDRAFSTHAPVCGLEIEAWLIDQAGLPAPDNQDFLHRLDDGMVVPELARFNFELNVPPQPLRGAALNLLEQELAGTWRRCTEVAGAMQCRTLMIGILPTLSLQELNLTNMSDLKRYRALNEQVLRLREGRPIELDIHGREHLHLLHRDVMLESAATSLQLHLKVHPDVAALYYNLSQIVSAVTLACATNSPYLFGKDLWEETRIPVFEQSVSVGGIAGAARGPLRRVSFGSGYVKQSLFECFKENQAHFPVLLPIGFDAPATQFSHLRLHNGTIWRWNRPLVGFDDDGTPHLRIEHRVLPAGPTLHDAIANAAFYFGLVRALAGQDPSPVSLLPFAAARDNFYAAARDGLDAQVTWLDGKRVPVQRLLLERLLPQADEGLELLGIDSTDRRAYLGSVGKRIEQRRTGSVWQRRFVERYGPDMKALTEAYYERQQSGEPVHAWDW